MEDAGTPNSRALGAELKEDLDAFGTEGDDNRVDFVDGGKGTQAKATYSAETKRVTVQVDAGNRSVNGLAKFAHEIDHSRRMIERGGASGQNLGLERIGYMIAGAVQGALNYAGPGRLYWNYDTDSVDSKAVLRGASLSCGAAQESARKKNALVPKC